jgi:hypothetical protein
MANIKKNVASQNVTFSLVSATTGLALTGATVTVYVTKDGTQALGTGTVTELKVSTVAYGAYNYAPTQAETNATDVGFLFIATGAIPVNYDFHTDVVDSNGYAGVNVVDFGGQTVTARDIGASVLLSPGTGTGQISLTSGAVTVGTNSDKTGYTLSQSFPPNFAALAITAGGIVQSDVQTIKTQTVTCSAGVTVPSSIASPTNITSASGITLAAVVHTGATIPAVTTVTSLTNAPTSGDFTSTMKASITAAATTSTPTVVVGSYATHEDPLYLLTGGSTQLAVGAAGVVTVGSYTSGQDPASLVLATPSQKIATDGSGNVSTTGNVVVDGGTVSASPAPATTGFTATGSLHAGNGGYTVAPMNVFFESGANQGVKFAITGHTVNASNHAFTVTGMTTAPSAGDTFVIV